MQAYVPKDTNYAFFCIQPTTQQLAAENFGGRKLWRIDRQQKLANNILANVLDYIAHVIQNDMQRCRKKNMCRTAKLPQCTIPFS